MIRMGNITMSTFNGEEVVIPTDKIEFDGSYGIVRAQRIGEKTVATMSDTKEMGPYYHTGIVTDERQPQIVMSLTPAQRLESFGNGNFVIDKEERSYFKDDNGSYKSLFCNFFQGHLKVVGRSYHLHQRFDPIYHTRIKWEHGLKITFKNPKWETGIRKSYDGNRMYIPVREGIIQVHIGGWCLYDINQGKVISPKCNSPLYFAHSPVHSKEIAFAQSDLASSETMSMFLDQDGNFVGDSVYSTFHNAQLPITNYDEYSQACAVVTTATAKEQEIHNAAIADLKQHVLGLGSQI